MKKMLMLFAGAMMAGVARAEVVYDVQVGDLKYCINTIAKTAAITGYDKSRSLTRVDVGEVEWQRRKYFVTSIQFRAFSGCSSLTSVSLPNVTEVHQQAFSGCSTLTSVLLPNASEIGACAFDGAPIENIELGIASLDYSVSTLLYLNMSSLKSLSLPNATKIDAEIFYDCTLLTSVSLPKVTEIGEYMFRQCPIENLKLGVKTITPTFFERAKSTLKSVSLPNATTIGEGAFADFFKLTSVSLPSATEIGEGAFKFSPIANLELGSASLGHVELDSIGVSASSLSALSLPNATTIGDTAFANYSKLISVSLPNATTIERNAFLNCTSLTTVVLGWDLLENPNRSYWRLRDEAELVGPITKEQTESVKYGVKTVCPKLNGEEMDESMYQKACRYYGVEEKAKPENPQLVGSDEKVVPEDAQIVGDGEIAVTKEAITAAKATTISVKGNEVKLGVSVKRSDDITAEPTKWEELEPVIITIPVKSKQGFMLINSREGRIAQ